jgi:hypothetical protein
MTITNINDLENFLNSNGGAITAAKVNALRIAARQFKFTDRDLQQILNNLAQELTGKEKYWEASQGGQYIFIKLRLVENRENGQYSLEVEMSTQRANRMAVVLLVKADNPDWTPQRFRAGDENLFLTLDAASLVA